MRLDRATLARLIPHAGSMCLLDGVAEWDAQRIACWTTTHRASDNPLRRDGVLAAVHGIEYGAQAAAVHGGLITGAPHAPAAGLIVAVRDVRQRVSRLDDIVEDLTVRAERLFGEANGVIYGFVIAGGGRELVSGRVSVLLRAGNAAGCAA